ncbi:MAG: redoxin domain-containing protein [Flavobacteriales bacterium]|nr:redoxin domain-containing protein [Flavobacteriales bacterium]
MRRITKIPYLYCMRISIAIILLFSLSFVKAQPPPDFTLYDQDSVAWNLYDELGKGNTVLLDFFFAACGPCQTFTPEIEQLYKDYGSGTGGLIVLGISDRDNNVALAAFDSTYSVTYPSGGTQGGGNDITSNYMLWFPFFSWPKYAVICTDTSIFWEVEPAIGMQALRNRIDTCDIVTGVHNQPKVENKLNIHPNPSSGEIRLQLSQPISDELVVQVYSVEGRLMKTFELEKSSSRGVTLNLSEFRSGSYIVEVLEQSSILARKKLMLIR